MPLIIKNGIKVKKHKVVFAASQGLSMTTDRFHVPSEVMRWQRRRRKTRKRRMKKRRNRRKKKTKSRRGKSRSRKSLRRTKGGGAGEPTNCTEDDGKRDTAGCIKIRP